MGRVSGVFHDASRGTPAPADIDVLNRRETAVGDLLGISHYPLQCFLICSRTISIPGGDGECERTLRHTPVESLKH